MTAQSGRSTDGTGWSVTGQQQTQKIINGNVVDGWVVSFRTQHGHDGTVFVPESQYTRDKVAEAVTGQAATMDAITTLQG